MAAEEVICPNCDHTMELEECGQHYRCTDCLTLYRMDDPEVAEANGR